MTGVTTRSEAAKGVVSRVTHAVLVSLIAFLNSIGFNPFALGYVPPHPPLLMHPPMIPIKNHLVPLPSPAKDDVGMHSYTFIFGGKAAFHGQPMPHASVLVRLTTPRGEELQGAVTDSDGSYSVQMKAEVAPNEPVDWSMEAYTPEFKKVELVGRRIAIYEEMTQTVETPIEFLRG